MSKTAYTYSGPVSNLPIGKGKVKPLITGETYSDLPADNQIVKNLIARRLLSKAGAIEPAASDLPPPEETVPDSGIAENGDVIPSPETAVLDAPNAKLSGKSKAK